MMKFFTYRTAGNFSVILVCAMLAACASTQRSSSGPGEQRTAAPIDERGRTSQQESAPRSQPAPGPESETGMTAEPAVTAGAPVEDSITREPVKTGKPLETTEPPDERMDAAPAAAAAPVDDDAETRRRLAEQEAEIERLRQAQRAEAARMEQQAREQEQEQERAQPPVAAQEQPAGTTSQPSQAAAPQAGSSSSAAPARDEAAAVFPPSAASEESAGDQAAAPGTIERSVYFDYDKSSIPAKYDGMLLEHAAYLKEHPDVKIEVQGNCDERGSREYNLALGARRAQAVKRALELGGADGRQIRTVSFGSEKPIATGKDEESYSKNRRVDIVY